MPLHLLSKKTKSFSPETIAATRFFERSALVRAVLLLCTVVLLLLISPGLSRAQAIQYTDNKPDQTLRSTMRVDPSTLGLSIEVPIAGYPGRGGISLPITLSYSSKQWRIDFEESWMSNGGLLRTESIPMFSEWAKAGWTTSADIPVIDWTGAGQQFNYDGTPFCGCGDEGGYYIKRIQVHMPGGSSLELRIDDTPTTSQFTFGTYYAVDGSNLRYEASSYTDGILYLSDGSRYVLNSSSAQYIDRNGNTLSYSATSRQWTDTQSRVLDVPLAATPSATTYTYNIPSTTSTPASYSVRWSTLQNALTNPGDELHYKTNMTFGIGETWNPRSPALFIGDGENRLYDGPGFPASEKFNPLVLAEIILPNGQHYLFTYNVFGELTKVVYPTGGYERFAYAAVPGVSFLKQPYVQANRGVVDRWLSPTGNSADELHWHYAAVAPEGASALTVSTTAPDNTVTERLMSAETSEIHENHNLFGFSNVELGMTFEERVFAPASAGGAMLTRTLTSYTTSGPTPGGWYLATRNPRAIKNVSIMLDTGTSSALTSTITMSHDDDLNVIATNRYDFTSISQSSAQTSAIGSISSGSLLRTEEATYLVNDPLIDGSVRSAYRTRNLLSLRTSSRIRDGGGNIVAQASIGYDQTSLQVVGNPGGWTDPQTPYRGNPTSSGSWLNTTNTYLTTQTTYDQFGNVRTTSDAKGNQSQIDYSAGHSYAYPTLTTSADPDGAGPLTSLTTETEYDADTGLPTERTDVNGQRTTFTYDPINRLKQTIQAADGGANEKNQTTIDYDDVNRTVTTTGDQNTYNDNLLKAQTLYDGLGRPKESRQYEGGTNYIAIQTEYDMMGRAFKSSSPFRPWQGETAVWATTTFDALGRVTSVATPDNASVKTGYSGNRVLVTDHNTSDDLRRKRISETDSLGRLKTVWEVTAADQYTEDVSFPNWPSVTKGYKTTYQYDSLDNLKQVSQGGQPARTFAYDSLKRLLSANNPESGTICYGTVNAGQCQANGYDANGNLVYKTDARGVRATFGYDALNRVINRSYQNDPSGTPAVTYVYDTLPQNGKGRLTSVSSSVSSYSYSGYDAMGRVTGASQSIGAQTYPITNITYDLAGHLKTMTYPSGRTVTNTFDGAGRLSSFAGNLGDGTQRTYSTGIVYSAFGGRAKEQFGTATPLFNKSFYNSRGQLAEIRVSTSYTGPTDTTWNRGAIINNYSYQCWGMCGGSNSTTSMTDNNGNLRKQEVYIPADDQVSTYTMRWQQYDYDSLNRLQWVREISGETEIWRQSYLYDRYGNRTIDQASTWGAGIPKPNFGVDPSTNRLTAPAGYSMSYDQAGNQTTDTYTGQGSCEFDAENKMTRAWSNNQWQTYAYDGDGRRIKRIVNGTETWQVYGIGGELIAEYAANAAPSNPQKEYGYRNGELLITATVTVGSGGSAFSFTDDPVVVATTTVRAVHLTELRTAVNQARARANLSPATWTDDPVQATVTAIKAVHITELRARLDEARAGLGLSTASYTDPNLISGYQIKVAHVQELRTRTNEALTTGAGTSLDLRWLVTDQLGTPRMIFDQSGSLASVSRHDYLPFGEELFPGTGGRTTAQGYTSSDNVRQKFTSKERDNETGLDYFGFRSYASTQGRFTTPDPLGGRIIIPQSLNRYVYVLNNPLRLIDPLGLKDTDPWSQLTSDQQAAIEGKLERQQVRTRNGTRQETAQEAFNRMIRRGAAGARDIRDRIDTVKNFIASAGGYKNDAEWQQITTITSVSVNALTVYASNNKAFLDALESKGFQVKSRSYWASFKEWVGGTSKDHPGDSARSETQNKNQTQFHYGQDHVNDSSYGDKRANIWEFHFDFTSSNTGSLSQDVDGAILHRENYWKAPDMVRRDLIQRNMIPTASQCYGTCGRN